MSILIAALASEMIVHYIACHWYRPPEEFWRAVRECPPMRSMEYKKALLAAGGGQLLKNR